jgi:hypothetical protein
MSTACSAANSSTSSLSEPWLPFSARTQSAFFSILFCTLSLWHPMASIDRQYLQKQCREWRYASALGHRFSVGDLPCRCRTCLKLTIASSSAQQTHCRYQRRSYLDRTYTCNPTSVLNSALQPTRRVLAQVDRSVPNQFMRNSMTHIGGCLCGAIDLRVSGAPEVMGYCHCRSCRTWSGSPVVAFSVWRADAVKIASGAEHIAVFESTPRSQRHFCSACGGHIMLVLPSLKLVNVLPSIIPTLHFAPALHINYSEAEIQMRDGLPKLRDFPAEFGGSGEAVLE